MTERMMANIRKVIRTWPAYRKFVENSGIDAQRVGDIKELPIIDKGFISSAIHMVPLLKVKSIIPSSGSTGMDFSFGLFGEAEMKRAAASIETFLQSRFDTKNKKTLLLNLLPGALSIPSSTASVASIGTRADTALYALNTFGSSFEQILLVGEPLFIKRLIEAGVETSIPWKYLPLYIIVGGEWVPEGYRRYLEEIVGYQRVYSSMGMAELGLNYFYETRETVMLRGMLSEDRGLLKMLFGDLDFCPMLFAYDETEIYLETVKEEGDVFESIILTTINPSRVLPLIRYKSGDRGRQMTAAGINRVLRNAGYMELPVAPETRFLAHFGRGKRVSGIFPEEIKEIIYGCREAASATTGNFVLSSGGDMIELRIQLRKDVYPDPRLENMYAASFERLPVYVRLYPFERFPHSLSFERKVNYTDESDHTTGRRNEEAELPAAV